MEGEDRRQVFGTSPIVLATTRRPKVGDSRRRRAPSANNNNQPRTFVFNRLSQGGCSRNRDLRDNLTSRRAKSQGESLGRGQSRSSPCTRDPLTVEDSIQSTNRSARREEARLAEQAARALPTPFPQTPMAQVAEGNPPPFLQTPMTFEAMNATFQAFLMNTHNTSAAQAGQGTMNPPGVGEAPRVSLVRQCLFQTLNTGGQVAPTVVSPMGGNTSDPTLAFVLEEVRKLKEAMKSKDDSNKETSNPLSLAIRNSPANSYIKISTLTYDGTTTAPEFVNIFELHMQMVANDDATCYKLFACALRGPAQTWYLNLPDASIESWGQLK